MTRLYLLRHAEADVAANVLAGRAPGIHLTAKGRRQAEALAGLLAVEAIDRIYTSPLERARQTAAALAAGRRIEPQAADELQEIDFGEWTGRAFEELAADDRWRRFNVFRSGAAAPGGESMLHAQTRIVAFMQRLVAEGPRAAIALVSHGDVIKSAVAYCLGVPLDLFHRIEIDRASVSAIEIGADALRALYINRTPPVEAG